MESEGLVHTNYSRDILSFVEVSGFLNFALFDFIYKWQVSCC